MIPIYGRERFYEVEKLAKSGEPVLFAGGHYVVVFVKYDIRTETGSFDVQEIRHAKFAIVDPRTAVLTGAGMALDAIGALEGVKLPRGNVEPDCDYRERLAAKLRGDDAARGTALRDSVRANP